MAELRPIPLATLLRRAYYEHTRSRAIFDLPTRSFYRTPDFGGFTKMSPRDQRDAIPNPDLSVPYAGSRAPNPIGPAAGPHTQLAQNIVLSWLAGAGIIELKTVQVRDRLTLSRPCIDMKTVGYNTEWSQELSLEDSLREYVKAGMVIEMLAGIRDSGFGIRTDTLPVFDISVGYDLAGITSPEVVRWLEQMRDATVIVEELRAEIPEEFSGLRDLPFRTDLSRSVTLSTFHGAPADEIERICEFLIGELGFHTVIKLNPPMLGRERVEHILHGVLGYDDVEVNPKVYERELRFDEGVDLVRRLQPLAGRRGVEVGVKCGNTLEVTNTGVYLKEPVQYLSGQPLHALHVALARRWREAFGAGLLVSFAGGVDAHNAADCVAAGLVPVTTCTDLLRPGGYARLPKYLQSLESRMRQLRALSIEEFIAKSAEIGGSVVNRDGPGSAGHGTMAGPVDSRFGPDTRSLLSPDPGSRIPPFDWAQGGLSERTRVERPGPDLSAALALNTQRLLDKALSDDRYRADRNRKPPRKLGTQLWLWDCLSCRKCIPVCPNDGIFELETESFVGEVPVIEVAGDGWREVERRLYRALKTTQIMIFADACNDCGNCDVFCPEDGGPNLEKPRFFGSLEAFRQAAPLTGFVVTMKPRAEALGLCIHGRFADGEYALEHEPGTTTALFAAPGARVTVDWASHSVIEAEPVPDLVGSGPDEGRSRDQRDASSDPALRLGSGRPERAQASRTAGSRVPGPAVVDLAPCLTLRLLLGGLMNPHRVNFVSAELAAARTGPGGTLDAR